VKEIIFILEAYPEGGYTVQSLSFSIFTPGRTIEEIKEKIKGVFRIEVEKPWIPRSSRGMTILSACFFVIPAKAGIQTLFSLDALQLYYE
jgi:hypothetical protein